METMTILPDVGSKRFGSLAFGYDRIGKVRDEHSALVGLAATLLGVDQEKVTMQQVQRLTGRMAALLGETTDEANAFRKLLRGEENQK